MNNVYWFADVFVLFFFFVFFLFFFVCFFFVFLFFQAEDGIRDLVRSRGLGDVYKRQNLRFRVGFAFVNLVDETEYRRFDELNQTFKHLRFAGKVAVQCGFADIQFFSQRSGRDAVSFTHLKLPTGDLG